MLNPVVRIDQSRQGLVHFVFHAFTSVPHLIPCSLIPLYRSGYSSWRKFCSLSVPNTTSELAEILGNFTLAHKLQLLYGTPHNIDVWVGAISEPALPGGRVGPLLSCLLARQFRALRDGDR